MAVPTSYTAEQFADFLKDEVLRDAADGLGFGDAIPEIPQVTGRVTIRTGIVGTFGTPPYNYTNGLPIYETGFYLPAGTSLTWSNGATRTIANAIDPTDVTMDISGLGANFMPENYATVVFRAGVARVRNPIYESILEEVLIQTGLPSIASVNSGNIRLFRQYGIVELLRKVMQNVAGNYNSTMPIGGPVGSKDVYEQVANTFQREQARLNKMLAEGVEITANIPDESLSQSGTTAIVW